MWLKAQCKEALQNLSVHTLFSKGHLTDPRQAWVYTCLLTVRRLLLRQPELRGRLREVLRLRNPNLRRGPQQGPVHALLTAMRQCGLRPAMVSRRGICDDRARRFLHQPSRGGQEFLHNTRAMLRVTVWAELAARRRSFEDAEAGLSRKWSRWHWDHSHGELRTFARVVATGGVETQHARWASGKETDWNCPFCDLGVAEDLNHMNWVCPAWARYRDEMLIPHGEDDLMYWPTCFIQHGLVPLTILDADEKPLTRLDQDVIEEVQQMLARVAQARTKAWEQLQQERQRLLERQQEEARRSLEHGLLGRERKRRRLVVC